MARDSRTLAYLCEGGTNSAGRVNGSGCPDFAMSTRCMARINSSALSFPSLSTSANVLRKGYIFTVSVSTLQRDPDARKNRTEFSSLMYSIR